MSQTELPIWTQVLLTAGFFGLLILRVSFDPWRMRESKMEKKQKHLPL
jgi:hypothetical protein